MEFCIDDFDSPFVFENIDENGIPFPFGEDIQDITPLFDGSTTDEDIFNEIPEVPIFRPIKIEEEEEEEKHHHTHHNLYYQENQVPVVPQYFTQSQVSTTVMKTNPSSCSSGSDEDVHKESKPRQRRKRKRDEIEKDNERLNNLKEKKNKSKEEKNELRKLRNRWSAHKSRQKKRKIMEEKDNLIKKLTKRLEKTEDENNKLKEKLKRLEQQQYGQEMYEQPRFSPNQDIITAPHYSGNDSPKRNNKRSKKNIVYVCCVFLFGVFLIGLCGKTFFGKELNNQIQTRIMLDTEVDNTETVKHSEGEEWFINNSVFTIDKTMSKVDEKLSFKYEHFEPKEMDYQKLIIPTDLKYHFNPFDNNNNLAGFKGDKSTTVNTTIEIIEDEDESDESSYTVDEKNEKETPISFDKNSGSLIPFEGRQSGSTEFAYIYKDHLSDDSKVYLMCPWMYPLLADQIVDLTDEDNMDDQKLVFIYPIEVYNSSNNEKVYRLAEIEVTQKDVRFSDSYFSFSQLNLNE